MLDQHAAAEIERMFTTSNDTHQTDTNDTHYFQTFGSSTNAAAMICTSNDYQKELASPASICTVFVVGSSNNTSLFCNFTRTTSIL